MGLGFWVLSKPIIQPTQLGFGLSLAVAKGAITLRDLTLVRYWFIQEIEIGEDSVEASNDTIININANALKTKDMRAILY